MNTKEDFKISLLYKYCADKCHEKLNKIYRTSYELKKKIIQRVTVGDLMPNFGGGTTLKLSFCQQNR